MGKRWLLLLMLPWALSSPVGATPSGRAPGPIPDNAPRTLTLYAFEAPPYQVLDNVGPPPHAVTGETVDTVRCAAVQAGWQTRIYLTPQKRALHALKTHWADGYFAIDPSQELDDMARRSNPVALEKWYLYSRTAMADLSEAHIGTVAGSNEQAWLAARRKASYLTVGSPTQLLALLERGRIDVVLMDERLMAYLQDHAHLAPAALERRFLRYAPLYLYLDKAFVSRHPSFLNTFNRALPDCMGPQLALNDDERARLRTHARALMADLGQRLNLEAAINDAPYITDKAEILTQDSQWQALAPLAPTALATTLLDLPASRALADWARQQPMVTEAMVINDLGALSATSRLTSDYWQGDEPKFQQLMGPAARQTALDVYVSPIRYDASTGRFQVTVSGRIVSPATGQVLGAVALGLDVEDALRATILD